MENDKEKKLIYNLLLEENLEAFLSAIRNQLHVYKIVDLTLVTRKDLSRIGILSGPDIRRFEKVVARVTKGGGIKGKFNKVLGKKQKPKESELPATVSLWDDFAPVIIRSEDLELTEILGEGNFGKVYEAEWKRRVGGYDCVIPVAVKCLKDDSSNAFIKEVSILSQLDQKHDNIIKLYGLSIHEDYLRMVTEFAEGGSLLNGLREGEFLSVSLLCQFAVQIASGMTYLEQKGLVHRDLAARNILVTAHNQVKISDFGLAKLVGNDKEWVMTREEVLPIRWLSLESLVEGKFTSASDVWSFGVVLWELFTFGEHPWKGFNSFEVVEKIRNGERLQEPDYCPSKVYSVVMLRCWTENPDERLNFEEAKSCLVSIHPTTSIATSSQHYLDDLKYNEGDCITAIKPFEGSPDMWIGQNETTNEFGIFMKSHTSPMQCKIPYASTSLISPGDTTPEIPVLENGGHERSQPVPIPSSKTISTQRRQSSFDEPSLPKSEQRRNSQLQTFEKASPTGNPIQEELSSSIMQDDESQLERPGSLPLPDKLAAGTFQRYPSTYVNMKENNASEGFDSQTDTNKTETSPPLQTSPDEPSVRPKVPPRTDLKKKSRREAKDMETPISSTANSGHSERPVPAKRPGHKKKPPVKPPRLPKKLWQDEPFYVNRQQHNDLNKAETPDTKAAVTIGGSNKSNSKFDIDPSAWMRDMDPPDYPDDDTGQSSNLSRQISRSEHNVFAAVNDDANQNPTSFWLNDSTKHNSVEKRILRKTQSLESISKFPTQQETSLPLLQDRVRSKSTIQPIGNAPNSDSFELESGEESFYDSSADSNISYKKFENEEGKKKTLFGLRKKKKSKKESLKFSITVESQNEHIKTLSEMFPEISEPEIYGALEISRWNVNDAVKFLKVKKLVNLGLCPQSSCLQMLKTYDWNVLEASYAIKIHHVMAIHLELSLEEVAKLLRENNWDVDVVSNIIKMRGYYEECKEIGFSEAEAEHTLSFLGNNIDDAICALKVRRVADVTQKPEDYCKKTLVHCQWSVERAIHYIIEPMS